MEVVIGPILLLVFVAMVWLARPPQGMDSVVWLQKPWMLGQVYVLERLSSPSSA